eukprot:3102924-Heterocapsa_arctica.AAC.1
MPPAIRQTARSRSRQGCCRGRRGRENAEVEGDEGGRSRQFIACTMISYGAEPVVHARELLAQHDE